MSDFKISVGPNRETRSEGSLALGTGELKQEVGLSREMERELVRFYSLQFPIDPEGKHGFCDKVATAFCHKTYMAMRVPRVKKHYPHSQGLVEQCAKEGAKSCSSNLLTTY